ncbi:unnamed protein product [Acanthoscelides obtectus]|uniref:dynamin GTPase n=1 Tax=Acanthoscelides obtectus TaxID=200917 RepID=A0A9P0PNB6_ACAOB|nr:unnamed protein product [Acanthoscelides obtectus]CAK1635957.1 Dynamin [Acanthoscelides obtectus]
MERLPYFRIHGIDDKQATYYEHISEGIRMIQHFAICFEKILEGSRSDDVNTVELSGGAKINCLFHERFPYEIVKMEFDEIELRREIGIAIVNIHGVRIGLFTPDLAFDAIVKKQIARLREPCMKIVDLVVNELSNIIHTCADSISRFPRLREVIERLITAHIGKREMACKDQLSVYIDCQLSYMNTNHEDFIGFANAENQAITSSSNNSLGNQVIRKGFLVLHNISFLRGRSFWFVLSSDNLAWYKDESEKEIQYILPLNKLKMRDVETRIMSRKPTFGLFYPSGANVYKDYKQLELSSESADELDSWKASFLRAGVYPEKDNDAIIEDGEKETMEKDNMDPQLKRQVEIIRNLVESYMKIVTKSIKDMVPKMITYMILSNTKRFIFDELLVYVYANDDQMELLEESPEAVKSREEKMAMYRACKSALDIIGDCSLQIATKTNGVEDERIYGKVQQLHHPEPPKPSTAVKKIYRMSTPPPIATRPAPPPPPSGTPPPLPERPHFLQ